ncbi:WD40 repeat domain-containing protein [Nocardia sp. NPDC059240]|uniref:WD40 repeat domain-containing protein n=1 Tax=Nocardia sp. NPDC059240 TaxID=3346786 RepID=UPI0036CBB619
MAEPAEPVSPREMFARRLTELWESAGRPPQTSVVAAANRLMGPARGPNAKELRFQKFAAWKSGNNLPGEFDSVWPVLGVLIARSATSDAPLPAEQLGRKYWYQLWSEAKAWTPEPVCPYRGLRSYRSEDADRFFGRDRAVVDLIALVEAIGAGGGGVGVLVGASGSGKSSLLAAGLIPKLDAVWTVVRSTPGGGDARALTPPAPGERRVEIVDQFEELFTTTDSEDERRDYLDRLSNCAAAGIVVIVGVRADFFARCLEYPVLAEALANQQVTDDAETVVAQRSVILGPLLESELREAISGPARVSGLKLETGLVDLILADLVHLSGADAAGALPLVSHVMQVMWERRSGSKLTMAAYVAAGRVASSIAHTADQAWQELEPEGRVAARHLLIAMVTVGDGTRDMRRRVTRSDLLARATDPVEAAAALETLARARLVTLDDGAVTLVHEVVLDAWPRLRGWIDDDRQSLVVRQRTEADAAEWESAGRSSALLYRGERLLRARGSDPEISGRSGAFLAASIRARQRRRAAEAATACALVVLLVLVSVVLVRIGETNRRRAADYFDTVTSEIDRWQTSDPTLAAELTVLANHLRPDDAGIRSRLVASQTSPVAKTFDNGGGSVAGVSYLPDGTLVVGSNDGMIRLWRVRGSGAAVSAGPAIADNAGGIRTFYTVGSLLVTTAVDHIVRIRDLSDPANPRLVRAVDVGVPITLAALSRDQHSLAVAREDGDVSVFDLAAPDTQQPIVFPVGGTIAALNFSSNGMLLATAYTKQNVFGQAVTTSVWSIDRTAGTAHGSTIFTGGDVPLIEVSETEPVLAIGDVRGQGEGANVGKSTVQFFRIDDPTQPVAIAPPFPVTTAYALRGFAHSSDGRVLLTISTLGSELWNLADPAQPTPLGSPLTGTTAECPNPQVRCAPMVTNAAFSEDGRNVAIGFDTGAVAHWALPGGVLAGQAGQVGVLTSAISANGERMITGAPGADARIWDIHDPAAARIVGSIPKPDYRLPNVSIRVSPTMSADGQFAATVLQGQETLLDVSQPDRQRTVKTFPGAVSIGFAADRRMLEAIYPTPFPRFDIWDFTDPWNPVNRGSGLFSFGSPNAAAALTMATSHDGHLVVALTDKLHVWQEKDTLALRPDSITATDWTGGGNGLAVSADDRVVAAGWGAGAVRLWSVADPSHVVPLGDPQTVTGNAVQSLDFAPTGATLAVGGADGTVQLWDASDPKHLVRQGQSLTPAGPMVWHVAFHPRGGFLLGAGDNGTVRIWDLNPDHAVTRICAQTSATIAARLAAILPNHTIDGLCRP